MKRFSFVLILFMAICTAAMAQTSQLATLMHNGQMQIFYGANALKEAHAVAEGGDVITLSAGQFAAVNITKPLTIRGAGMGLTNTDTFHAPTILSGDFELNVPANDNYSLLIEGIQHNQSLKIATVKNAMLSKCVFNNIERALHDEFVDNLKFIHCDVRGELDVWSSKITSFTAVNCRIAYVHTSNSGQYIFQNCILNPFNPTSLTTQKSGAFYNSTLTNCIIAPSNYQGYVMSSSTAFYCVWFGPSANNPFPDGSFNGTNTKYEGDKLFKEGTFYELVDEAKSFATSDGTEIGIYGGSLPFDPTTTVPQITKFNVSPKTSADGKLSIDIEVKNAD